MVWPRLCDELVSVLSSTIKCIIWAITKMLALVDRRIYLNNVFLVPGFASQLERVRTHTHQQIHKPIVTKRICRSHLVRTALTRRSCNVLSICVTNSVPANLYVCCTQAHAMTSYMNKFIFLSHWENHRISINCDIPGAVLVVCVFVWMCECGFMVWINCEVKG